MCYGSEKCTFTKADRQVAKRTLAHSSRNFYRTKKPRYVFLSPELKQMNDLKEEELEIQAALKEHRNAATTA